MFKAVLKTKKEIYQSCQSWQELLLAKVSGPSLCGIKLFNSTIKSIPKIICYKNTTHVSITMYKGFCSKWRFRRVKLLFQSVAQSQSHQVLHLPGVLAMFQYWQVRIH